MGGRNLNVSVDPNHIDDDAEEEEVSFIEVSRNNLMSSLEDLMDIEDFFIPLKVQFMGEVID